MEVPKGEDSLRNNKIVWIWALGIADEYAKQHW
jgi:hypothetical protein